jgi:hypothetical protein
MLYEAHALLNILLMGHPLPKLGNPLHSPCRPTRLAERAAGALLDRQEVLLHGLAAFRTGHGHH